MGSSGEVTSSSRLPFPPGSGAGTRRSGTIKSCGMAGAGFLGLAWSLRGGHAQSIRPGDLGEILGAAGLVFGGPIALLGFMRMEMLMKL